MALDAASRGLRTALVERDDFASGTSSKSSKLVHGGLRYLQNGDVRLVYEALRERQRLRRNAPHLVRLLPVPHPACSRKDGLINPKVARALGSAMWMYDLTGGARIGKLHKRLKKAKAARPTCRRSPRSGWPAAYLYYDAAADDARLTLTILRTAALDHGAVVANHASVVELLHRRRAGGRRRRRGRRPAHRGPRPSRRERHRRVERRRARPRRGHATPTASGPPRASTSRCRGRRCATTSPWSCRCRRTSAACSSCRGCPTDDGGFELTYIGTTDTDYDGPLDDPQCTADDIAYLLRAINAVGARAAQRGRRARHLGRAAAAREGGVQRPHRRPVAAPQGHPVRVGRHHRHRRQAHDLPRDGRGHRRRAGRPPRRPPPLRPPLPHRAAPACAAPSAPTPSASGVARHLADRYGGEAAEVQALIDADPSLGEPLVPGLPYLRAEAVHAARHEMATTVDDVLARRTRARLQARDASAAAAPAVAALMAAELGWSAEETERQVGRLRRPRRRRARRARASPPPSTVRPSVP